jgi:hypothetical protein
MRPPGVDLECVIHRPVAGIEATAGKRAGVDGWTHEQILMDRFEAHAYKEGSVIEISAKRLRLQCRRRFGTTRTSGPAEGRGRPRGMGDSARQGQGSWRLGVSKPSDTA